MSRIAEGLDCHVTLSCSRLLVEATQLEAADLARAHGFDAVEPDVGFLMTLTDDGVDEMGSEMAARSLRFGPANLPMSLSGPAAEYDSGMERLPEVAARTARLGVPGFIRWLAPCSNELTYREHFDRTAQRIRRCAEVVGEYGQRLGLEYLGPRTEWVKGRYPFVHSLAGLIELIEATGAANVGLQLDSFHWHTADEGVDELIRAIEIGIVVLELNDAVPGRSREMQRDRQRRLPSPDGVIDIATFIGTVLAGGYDGPVHAEPHDESLRGRPGDAVVATAAAALTAVLSPHRGAAAR